MISNEWQPLGHHSKRWKHAWIGMSSRSSKHTHTRLSTAPCNSSIHPPTHTPVTTANPKPCHNRERVTPQSAQPLQFISHKRGKIKRHFNPSQHTALHSQAITGTLERGWLREGGGGGWHTFFVKPLLGTLVLYCGYHPIFWWDTGQLAAESNHSISMAVIIVRNNTEFLLYHCKNMNAIKHWGTEICNHTYDMTLLTRFKQQLQKLTRHVAREGETKVIVSVPCTH